MFSYRHAFHAGNHADVLKHAVFVHILDYFNRKETPYWVIDTHAGAGIYDLTGDWAAQSGECVDGLDRLLGADTMPALIDRYLNAVLHFNPDGLANLYPGSPWLALHALRSQDRLRLFEMHPSEIDVLKQNLGRQGRLTLRQTAVYESDGFKGLKALLPPPPRRGLILIDPSYEDKRDYRKTLQAVRDGLTRFATGCFIVWYPLVQRGESHELARSLERLEVDSWVHTTLTVCKPASDGYGLHGSGMFVVNPPWTLYKELEQALPWLREKLGQDDNAGFTLTQYPKGA
ncbi:23S rRNA (adenine(2030)-N(6))-methyltransferase RlmJ [Paralcaligenes ureilyticus]|uniref:Ribosomal RNA large subunit methyltransferase J n=1 Tax=Paralcaligenes ureilyticus TaxID=627131 RepID=A0A4R3LSP6_9BURK|nr:23S rRNA (adenine(2030)-N(6))-methyltransferase RlmJ [Paralcaligenes ureilyticus]TCT01625.1 23S rRNA (adenine2030-N6)-methyltransferase [Paralcaligenes ureilyticus]